MASMSSSSSSSSDALSRIQHAQQTQMHELSYNLSGRVAPFVVASSDSSNHSRDKAMITQGNSYVFEPSGSTSTMEVVQLNAMNVELLNSQKRANIEKHSKLSSTILAEQNRVQREVQKLMFVQQELGKLDKSLTKNIDLLRIEIEKVGREVSNSQKDFDEKERLYLEARQELARKKQRKMLLTGHLDFIILTNERNKANKLAELEKQMQNGSSTASVTASSIPPIPSVSEATRSSSTSTQIPTQPAFPGFSQDDITKFEL